MAAPDPDPLMGVRAFLRGGFRDLTEPTTIISGTIRLGVWTPASRSAHPDPEAVLIGGDRAVSPEAPSERKAPASTGSDGQSEASGHGGSAPPSAGPAGVSGHAPQGTGRRSNPKARSIANVLDDANKAGRS